jgi:ferredoxin-NADP reductase
MFVSTLVFRREIAPGILEIGISKPDNFAFVPGQLVRFYLEDTSRDYTIVCHEHNEIIELCVALVDGGRFSHFITTCPIGHLIQFSGPHGRFVYQKSPRQSIFVATGTGVAPFVAFCRSGITGATLLQGVSVPEQLIYKTVLEGCFEKYVPCISQLGSAGNALKGGYAGRVTDYIKAKIVPGVYDFYVCGQTNMIADVTALIDDMYSDSRLFVENYQ